MSKCQYDHVKIISAYSIHMDMKFVALIIALAVIVLVACVLVARVHKETFTMKLFRPPSEKTVPELWDPASVQTMVLPGPNAPYLVTERGNPRKYQR
jgi:hypothetical protein